MKKRNLLKISERRRRKVGGPPLHEIRTGAIGNKEDKQPKTTEETERLLMVRAHGLK